MVHTTTYLVVGAVAFTILDYPTLFAEPSLQSLFRQTDDPWVLAGPLFQPLRGLLLGAMFYVLRESSLFGTCWTQSKTPGTGLYSFQRASRTDRPACGLD
ncbi:MAG: hypothetical protein V3T48_09825 [Vicinamibacterales bacterium]